MSLRAKTLHYLNFQNQNTFLMKAKWNHCIAVDVNDFRKNCHDIVLIAKYSVFLNMVAKRSYSDRSLKVKYKVLQELKKGASQRDLRNIYAILPNTHHINIEEEQGQNSWILWKGTKLEKNQTRDVWNNKQSPHEMVIENGH